MTDGAPGTGCSGSRAGGPKGPRLSFRIDPYPTGIGPNSLSNEESDTILPGRTGKGRSPYPSGSFWALGVPRLSQGCAPKD